MIKLQPKTKKEHLEDLQLVVDGQRTLFNTANGTYIHVSKDNMHTVADVLVKQKSIKHLSYKGPKTRKS